MLLILLTLVATPAGAQVDYPWWTSNSPEVLESDGEIELTLSSWRPGRLRYQTVDWTARAPEDYTAVSGELVFTEPGSRTITIPIVDDDLAEGSYEGFSVDVWEEPPADPATKSDRVPARIIDDDNPGDADDEPAAAAVAITTTTTSTTPTASAAGAPSPSAVSEPAPPTTTGASLGQVAAPTTTTATPSPDLAAELASEELQVGPGFELPNAEAREDAPVRGGGGGGSTRGLALGLGTAAVGVGAVVWVHGRRRWSPKRA